MAAQLASVGNNNEPTPDPVPTFDDFWHLWPQERRLCKKDARLAWLKAGAAEWPAILHGLLVWSPIWRARGEWEYVPHPHRWIRNERYYDEPPVSAKASTMAHLPFAQAAATKREPMPADVLAALQRIRTGR